MVRSILILLFKTVLLALPIAGALYVLGVGGGSPKQNSNPKEVASQVETSQEKVEKELPPALEQEERLQVQTIVASENLDTVKIKSGDMLTKISAKYYGNKVFWIYLYKHNESRISNPNNVPIGTTIIVPHSTQYDIDASDKASIERARKLWNKINNELQ